MTNRRINLRTDQRGAVAFEMPFVTLFIMISLIIPIADTCILGYNSIAAFQALRNAGQYLQYHPPIDVTAAYTLPTEVATIGGYLINNPTLTCGTSGCGAAPTALPKYYTFTTSFTLTPTTIVRSILCVSNNTNPCTYTVSYSERFQ